MATAPRRPSIPAASVSAPTPSRKTSPAAWVVLGVLLVGAFWLLQAGYFRAYTNQFRDTSLPPMPVDVAYRESLVGRGRVFVLRNTSDRQLSVVATLKNPTTKQERSYRVDLSPRGTREIGWGEGWTASSGDAMTLSHNDYKSYSATIP